jgi:hypothetical protein
MVALIFIKGREISAELAPDNARANGKLSICAGGP